MTVGTMVKRFAHMRSLVDCLWVQPLFTLSVPCDIFRTPALIWGRFIDSGNQVGRTRSDIQAAGPRRCQSQIVLLLLGCKAGLMVYPVALIHKPSIDSMKVLMFPLLAFLECTSPHLIIEPFDHGRKCLRNAP